MNLKSYRIKLRNRIKKISLSAIGGATLGVGFDKTLDMEQSLVDWVIKEIEETYYEGWKDGQSSRHPQVSPLQKPKLDPDDESIPLSKFVVRLETADRLAREIGGIQ